MTAQELIERLERGETGTSIDFAIAQLLRPLNDDGTFKGPTPKYFARITTSLDAAIALVERVRPGATYSIQAGGGLASYATIFGRTNIEDQANAEAPTPAAALIAALLKAEAK